MYSPRPEPSLCSFPPSCFRALTAALAVALFAACPVLPTDDLEVPLGRPLASLGIESSSLQIKKGDVLEFKALALDDGGERMSTTKVKWELSNTSVAAFKGVKEGEMVKVEGVASGETTLSASLGGKTASVTLEIWQELDSLKLAEPKEPLVLGETWSPKVEAFDIDGEAMAVDFSIDAHKGTILLKEENGHFRAVGIGQTEVTASAGGKTSTITVEVRPHSLSWKDEELLMLTGGSLVVEVLPLGSGGEVPQVIETEVELEHPDEIEVEALGPSKFQLIASEAVTGKLVAKLAGRSASADIHVFDSIIIDIEGPSETVLFGDSPSFSASLRAPSGEIFLREDFSWMTGSPSAPGDTGAFEGEGFGSSFSPETAAIGAGSVWAKWKEVSAKVDLTVLPVSVGFVTEGLEMLVGSEHTVHLVPYDAEGQVISKRIWSDGSEVEWTRVSGAANPVGRSGNSLTQATIVGELKGTSTYSAKLYGVEAKTGEGKDLTITVAELSAVTIEAEEFAGDSHRLPMDRNGVFLKAQVSTDPPISGDFPFQIAWDFQENTLQGSRSGVQTRLSGFAVGVSEVKAKAISGATEISSDPVTLAVVPGGVQVGGEDMLIGEEAALVAQATNTDGLVVDAVNFAGSWLWEIDSPEVASLDLDNEKLKALAAGTVTLSATWIPPYEDPIWDGPEIKGSSIITVEASQPPEEGEAPVEKILKEDFASWELIFPVGRDDVTPENELLYEVYGSKDGTDPFEGLLLAQFNAADAELLPEGRLSFIVDLYSAVETPATPELLGASPYWSLGLKVVDGEGLSSPGRQFAHLRKALPQHRNPLIFSWGRLAFFADEERYFYLGEMATAEGPSAEWTTPRASNGEVIAVVATQTGQMLNYRPAGDTWPLEQWRMFSFSTEPEAGSCSAEDPRNVKAYLVDEPLLSVEKSVLVNFSSEGLSCSESALHKGLIGVRDPAPLFPSEVEGDVVDFTASGHSYWVLTPDEESPGELKLISVDLSTELGPQVEMDSISDPAFIAASNGEAFLLELTDKRITWLKPDSRHVVFSVSMMGDCAGFEIFEGEEGSTHFVCETNSETGGELEIWTLTESTPDDWVISFEESILHSSDERLTIGTGRRNP